MLPEIKTYCSSSQINNCVDDSLGILKGIDFTAHPYLKSSIEVVGDENEKLSQSIGTVRSSKYTKLLEEDDNQRDRLLSGLTQVTKTSMLRADKLIAENASEVYRTLKAHGLNLRHRGYQSESAGIDSLSNELATDNMKVIIDTLPETKAFLQELISANDKFKSNFDKSMTHQSEIEKLNAPYIQMKLIRHLFNTKIVRFINMMVEVDAATFMPIAKQIAPYIEKINTTAKASKSRKNQ